MDPPAVVRVGDLYVCNINQLNIPVPSGVWEPAATIDIFAGQIIEIVGLVPNAFGPSDTYRAIKHATYPQDEFFITDARLRARNEYNAYNFTHVGWATGGRRRKHRKSRKSRKTRKQRKN